MAGIVVVFTFSGAASQTWIPEDDYVIYSVGKSITSQAGMLATDPNLTIANIASPSSTAQLRDVLFYIQASSNVNQFLMVDIKKGAPVFVSMAAAGSLILYLQSPAEIPAEK